MRQRQNQRSRKGSSRPASSRNSGRRNGGGSKSGSKWIIWVVCGAAVLAVAGFIIWWVLRPTDNFKRIYLDEYVKLEQKSSSMKPGSSVYLDMSDGMNFAYSSTETKSVLKEILNRLSGTDGSSASKFFELSENNISPLEQMSQTELYNYMMNSGNYAKQEAPIEKTLQQIVNNGQPALLITDFEEYNNGTIQQASYAKDYFVTWLSQGRFISFYKWDFNEKDKEKALFVTVFDGEEGAFASNVETAIALTHPASMEKFVLGGPDFNYPMAMNYESSITGGNYHDRTADGKQGKDLVSGVLEDGSAEAFRNYAQPTAPSNTKDKETAFLPVQWKSGIAAQYYPVFAQWSDIVKNAEQMKEPQEGHQPYTHFIGQLFVDLEAQDGFDIEGIEARAFDYQEELSKFGEQYEASKAETDGGKIDFQIGVAPEITEMFTASLSEEKIDNSFDGREYNEIFLDFDDKFTGSSFHSTSKVNPTDLIRVNIVISKVKPNVEKAKEFFSWPGNESLSQSVVHALTSSKVSPQGTILMSYYLKSKVDK